LDFALARVWPENAEYSALSQGYVSGQGPRPPKAPPGQGANAMRRVAVRKRAAREART